MAGVARDFSRESRERELDDERRRAAAAGEPYCDRYELGVSWDAGAPCPKLIEGEQATMLVFYCPISHPDFDGTNPMSVSASGPTHRDIAIVELLGCTEATLGEPNDEGLHEHPLYGRGLEYYAAHEVRNSPRVSDAGNLRHFVFTFHDETLEFVAIGTLAEVVLTDMRLALELAVERAR